MCTEALAFSFSSLSFVRTLASLFIFLSPNDFKNLRGLQQVAQPNRRTNQMIGGARSQWWRCLLLRGAELKDNIFSAQNVRVFRQMVIIACMQKYTFCHFDIARARTREMPKWNHSRASLCHLCNIEWQKGVLTRNPLTIHFWLTFEKKTEKLVRFGWKHSKRVCQSLT